METVIHPKSTNQSAANKQPEPRDAVSMADGAIQSLRNYVEGNPESAALWCLGIGFVLGWKLKPW